MSQVASRRKSYSSPLCWIVLAFLAAIALLGVQKLVTAQWESAVLAEAVAKCPKDIDVDLGGTLFRLPIVNNLTIELDDDSITPASARSLTPLRGTFMDNWEYAQLCRMALTEKPVRVRDIIFSFWGEQGSVERISDSKRTVDFCKFPTEFGNARLCREGYIRGDLEPDMISLVKGSGISKNPYEERLRNALSKFAPKELGQQIKHVGNLSWVTCCGGADTRYYFIPPADAAHFDDESTIVGCAKIGDERSCEAFATYLKLRLRYGFSDAARAVEKLEELDRSVLLFLERLRVKQ